MVGQIRLERSDWVQLVFVYPQVVSQTHLVDDNPMMSAVVSHYRHPDEMANSPLEHPLWSYNCLR